MDIKQQIAQMTLEEKCSLLSGLDFWHTKPVDRLGIKSVMVSDGPHGLRKQDENGDHLGINDSIKAVCFPAACATAAGFSREVLYQVGDAVGTACQHEQVAVNLGPAINIKRSPLCGRNFEYFSEDPYLAGELAAALTNGVQQHNIGVSAKHFAANSQENRRMSGDSVVDERTLREIYLAAFETVVKKAKPWTIMCSYNKINGTYACENRWLLTDVLRNEWGFDGYVMSDWGAVDDRILCVHAGLDLEMPSSGGSNDKRVLEAVKSGRLSESDVDLAVERILTINNRYLDNARPETEWDMEAQHALAGRLAAECMVLLKNEDDILPLTKGDSIAVIGRFAAEPRYQGGGSSHINSFKVTSLLDALEGVPGITYAQGYNTKDEQTDDKLLSEAVKAAAAAKVAVIIAGLPDAFESEGYDRSHMRMPACQVELIEKVAAANPNTVVVLYNGSPVEMPWIGRVKAVIEGYLGGQNVGTATRDVLFGDENPSGRLPESFPLKLEHNPSYLNYGGEGNRVEYTEGVFVGYRYYTRKCLPVLFPFGHGLSYTKFEYSNLALSSASIKDTDELTVTVDVKNTGSRAGKEVVQLYVADRVSEVFRPVRELKGFEKIALEPGETKTVSFTLSKRAFAYWNTRVNDWFVESGAFGIEICKDAETVLLSAEVNVEGTVQVIPELTVNSIPLDLQKDPAAQAVFGPMFEQALKAFTGGGSAEDGDAPITDDMGKAMVLNMPLRTLASFSGGALSYDMLQAMVDKVNESRKS